MNEAMIFGLPVIVTDRVGSAEDLVRDGVNGFVIGHKDDVALKSRLESLVESEVLRRQFGCYSQKLISEFTPSAAANGIASELDSQTQTRNDGPSFLSG